MKRKLILALLCFILPASHAVCLSVTNLRVQSLRNPMPVDAQTPQFTWQLQSSERDVMQTSYRLVVTTDKDGENVVWDSGTTDSDKSVNVAAKGILLQPATRYYWHVTVRDNKGNEARSKETAYFETGLMDSGWDGAIWIKAGGQKPGEQEEEITDYIVEGKVRIERTAAGLCFACQDEGNFYFWQLNTEGSYPRLRPHQWKNGSPSCLADIDLTGKISLNNTDEFLLHIEVTQASNARTYINNVLVDERKGNFKFGKIGMREDHGERDTREEIGVYDDISVKKADGTTLFYEDFSDSNSFTAGTISNGKLRIVGSTQSHVLAWQKTDKNEFIHYAIDYDMLLVKASAAVIFAATSNNTYHMWQINTYDNATPAVRHHIYRNGTLTWNDATFTQFTKSQLLGHLRHYRVEVENGVIRTFIDGTLVDTFTDNTGMVAKGDIGLRIDPTNTGEEAYFDNIAVTEYGSDGNSTVVLSENFESPFSDYFLDAQVEEQQGSNMCHLHTQSGEKKLMQTTTDGEPMLRKKFDVHKKILSAKLFTSGLGVYDLFINGRRVGHVQPDSTLLYEELKLGWTDYRYRVFYSMHDVTPFLVQGENALGAIVTSGWWAGAIMHGAYGSHALGFLAKLLITYDDFSRDIIVSDLSWLSSTAGPLKLGDIYDGEIYDARLAAPWTEPDFDDSQWESVSENTAFNGCIEAFTGGYVQTLPLLFRKPLSATIHEGSDSSESDYGMAHVVSTQQGQSPVSLKKGQSVIFDFGQNIVGWVAFKVKGASGSRLRMRFVEMLNDTGSRSRGNDGPGGTPYLANLRSAKASLYYILRGDAQGESYCPSSTFFGFRYCEVTPSDDIEILAIEAQPVSSSSEDCGFIETSNALVNQLFSNIQWGQRGNLLSIPTDCPQRDERLGWMADTQVFSRTGMFNAFTESFYRKWLQDVRDGQRNDGAYPGVAPECWGTPFGQCVWADAGILVPWNVYLMTGNKDVLRENFTSMERYMDYLSTQVFDGYQYNGGGLTWGDWLSFANTDTRYISVAYYALDAQLMAKMSDALSESNGDAFARKAEAYRQLFENIKAEFRTRFLTPVRQTTQTAYLMALGFDLLEGTGETEQFKRRLSNAIRSNGYKLNTGFAGTAILCTTLSHFGLTDYAYDLLLQRECPSWLYSVDQGATTIWERWNSYTKESGFGDPGMNSFNHYAYGAVGEWMYRYMLGIEYDEQQPGFRHIILQPQPDRRTTLPKGQERITSANGYHQSYYGHIRSAWQLDDDDALVYECTVPPNTTATLFLPAADEQAQVFEGTVPAAEAEGVRHEGYADGCHIFHLGSGNYHFSTNLKASHVTSTASEDEQDLSHYNLSGRQVDTALLQQGIYIIGKKKVLVK